MVDYTRISEDVITGDFKHIKKLTKQALDVGAKPQEILEKGLLPGMDVVGQRFKKCEIWVPEVLRSALTMHSAMDIIRPLLSESHTAGTGILVIGTVEGDLHDIGKNLVTMMFEGAGFKVVDMGVNVKPQGFVDAVKEHKPNILGLSSLLTTTMPKIEETINAVKEGGIRDRIKVMAGGAPVTQDFSDRIGADAYGSNAITAVEKAKSLIGKG